MSYNFYENKYSEEELREYIEKYPEKLDWGFWLIISTHQDLSEDFIRDFQEEVIWPRILQCQNLSEEFLIDNLEKIEIKWFLINNQRIPEDVKQRIYNLKKVLDQ